MARTRLSTGAVRPQRAVAEPIGKLEMKRGRKKRDDSDEDEPPKKRKRVKAGGVKRGALSQALKLPNEILSVVFAHLSVQDLLAVAWSCHRLRDLLLTRTTGLVAWRNAFEKLYDDGLPRLTDAEEELVNLPTYAALIYAPGCTECGAQIARGWRGDPDFGTRTRLCKDCDTDLMLRPDSKAFKSLFGKKDDLDPRVLHLVVTRTTTISHEWNDGDCLVSEVEAVIEELESLDEDEVDRLLHFNAGYREAQARLSLAKRVNKPVAQWIRSIKRAGRSSHRYGGRLEFIEDIEQRLQDLGYSWQDVDYLHMEKFTYKKLPRGEISDDKFAKLLPKLKAALAARDKEESEKRATQSREERIAKLKRALGPALDAFEAAAADGQPLPRVTDLLHVPLLNDFVERKANASDQADIQQMKASLPQIVAEWQADMRNDLLELVRLANPHEENPDVLDRPDSLFYCRTCVKSLHGPASRRASVSLCEVDLAILHHRFEHLRSEQLKPSHTMAYIGPRAAGAMRVMHQAVCRVTTPTSRWQLSQRPERLTVVEAPGQDPSVATLAPSTFQTLDFHDGDIITVRSNSKETVLVARSFAQSDDDERTLSKVAGGEIMLSERVRANLGLAIGAAVDVELCRDCEPGTRIRILPIEEPVTADVEQTVKAYFKDNYRPVHVGDVLSVDHEGRNVELKVVEVETMLEIDPIIEVDSASYCMVAPHTIIDMQGEPVKREDHQSAQDDEPLPTLRDLDAFHKKYIVSPDFKVPTKWANDLEMIKLLSRSFDTATFLYLVCSTQGVVLNHIHAMLDKDEVADAVVDLAECKLCDVRIASEREIWRHVGAVHGVIPEDGRDYAKIKIQPGVEEDGNGA